jgi:hypothetical protein
MTPASTKGDTVICSAVAQGFQNAASICSNAMFILIDNRSVHAMGPKVFVDVFTIQVQRAACTTASGANARSVQKLHANSPFSAIIMPA